MNDNNRNNRVEESSPEESLVVCPNASVDENNSDRSATSSIASSCSTSASMPSKIDQILMIAYNKID